MESSLKNIMPPMWLAYPHINQYSEKWNEAYTKQYKTDWIIWFESLNEQQKDEYKEMFPDPKRWYDFYKNYKDENCPHKNYLNDIILWTKNGRPEYSIFELKKDYNKGKNIDYVFFWGHTPSKDGQLSKACFSQWWKGEFKEEENTYCCMEQYMMAKKAELFGDNEIKNEIMNCNQPNKIQHFGRKVKKFNQDTWNRCKYSIVLNGNYLKFIQNKDLMLYLFSTKDKILVEASPYDGVWGIKTSENSKNPNNWKGENLLGFALTEVKNELKNICKNYDKVDWEYFNKLYYLY